MAGRPLQYQAGCSQYQCHRVSSRIHDPWRDRPPMGTNAWGRGSTTSSSWLSVSCRKPQRSQPESPMPPNEAVSLCTIIRLPSLDVSHGPPDRNLGKPLSRTVEREMNGRCNGWARFVLTPSRVYCNFHFIKLVREGSGVKGGKPMSFDRTWSPPPGAGGEAGGTRHLGNARSLIRTNQVGDFVVCGGHLGRISCY